MSQVFDYAVEIRGLIQVMESEVGLEELTHRERDILYAACRLSLGKAAVRSEAIRSHPLVAKMSHPTYHRSLQSVVRKGFLDHAPETLAGAYVLNLARSALM